AVGAAPVRAGRPIHAAGWLRASGTARLHAWAQGRGHLCERDAAGPGGGRRRAAVRHRDRPGDAAPVRPNDRWLPELGRTGVAAGARGAAVRVLKDPGEGIAEMSTPLAIFQQIWSECIPADVLPYVEAVNRNVDTNTLPYEWGAAILQAEARTDVTLGSMPWVEESGTFLIGLFSRSGSGP